MTLNVTKSEHLAVKKLSAECDVLPGVAAFFDEKQWLVGLREMFGNEVVDAMEELWPEQVKIVHHDSLEGLERLEE